MQKKSCVRAGATVILWDLDFGAGGIPKASSNHRQPGVPDVTLKRPKVGFPGRTTGNQGYAKGSGPKALRGGLLSKVTQPVSVLGPEAKGQTTSVAICSLRYSC